MAGIADELRRAKKKRTEDEAATGLPDTPLISPELAAEAPAVASVGEAPPAAPKPKLTFDEAFAAHRAAGDQTFEWEGNEYTTQTEEEAASATVKDSLPVAPADPVGVVDAGNVGSLFGGPVSPKQIDPVRGRAQITEDFKTPEQKAADAAAAVPVPELTKQNGFKDAAPKYRQDQEAAGLKARLARHERQLRQGLTTFNAVEQPEGDIPSVLEGMAVNTSVGLDKAKLNAQAWMSDALDEALGRAPSAEAEVLRADQMRKYDQAQGRADAAKPTFNVELTNDLYDAYTSLAQTAPSLAIGVLTKNPALALGMAGAQAADYLKYKKRGASTAEASLGALGEGAVEVLTEMSPMGLIVNKFGKVGAGEFLSGFLGREMLGEQVATVAQDAIDTAIANPDKTWGEYLAERPAAAYHTALAVLVTGGTLSAANTVATGVASVPGRIEEAQATAAADQAKTAALSAWDKAFHPAPREEAPTTATMPHVGNPQEPGRVTADDAVLDAALQQVAAEQAAAEQAVAQAPIEPTLQDPEQAIAQEDPMGRVEPALDPEAQFTEQPVQEAPPPFTEPEQAPELNAEPALSIPEQRIDLTPMQQAEQTLAAPEVIEPVQVAPEGVVSEAPQGEPHAQDDPTGAAGVPAALQPGAPHPDTAILDQIAAARAASSDPAVQASAVELTGVTVVDRATLPNAPVEGQVSQDELGFLDAVGELTGTRYVLINAPNMPAEQFVVPSAKTRTVYVNAAHPLSAGAIITGGHETNHLAMHTLRNSADPEDRAIAKSVDDFFRKNLEGEALARYIRYYEGQDPDVGLSTPAPEATMTPDGYREEAGSDIAGNLFGTQAFQARLLDAIDAAHGATGVKRYVNAVKRAINKLVGATLGRKYREDFVNDLEQARELIAQALIRYHVNHGVGAEMAKTRANLALGVKSSPKRKAGKPRTIKATPAPPAAQVVFEIAPDPNNAALAGEWNALPAATRREISAAIAEKIIPRALRAFGVTGTLQAQVGSYLDDTNPSFALQLDAPGPIGGLTRFLGYVLSQDSMVAVAEQEFAGSEEVGSVTVVLPPDADVEAIYRTLRDIQVDGAQPVAGQSTVGGMMSILNYSGIPTLELARLADAKLGGKYRVGMREVYAYFPEKKDYGYADRGLEQQTPAGRAPLQGRADTLRAEATRLVRDALDRGGKRGPAVKRSGKRSGKRAFDAATRRDLGPTPYARRQGDPGRDGLLATYRPSPAARDTFAALGVPTPDIHETTDAGAFRGAIQAAKAGSPYGAAVYVYDANEYQGMRLFLAEGGKTGFALKGDDIVSVFNNDPALKGAAHAMLPLAVQLGGRRLDAFDTVLPALYAAHGFKAASRTNWDGQWAPDNWDKATFAGYNNGEPDVVFMAHDPAYAGVYSSEDGQRVGSYDEAVALQAAAVTQASNPTRSNENADRQGSTRNAGDRSDAADGRQAGGGAADLDGDGNLPGRAAPAPPRSDGASDGGRRAGADGVDRGDRQEHAVQVTGVHYSQQPRDTLDSSKFGAGMRGAEGPRLADWSAVPEQRHRIYFYVDEGNGIVPESGVGPYPHPVDLGNLYPAATDPLGFRAVAQAKTQTPGLVANYYEQAVMAAGFDGVYYQGAFGKQGGVVLLGERKIEIKRSPMRVTEPGKPGYTDPYDTLETRPDTTDAQRDLGRSALAAAEERIWGRSALAQYPDASVLGSGISADFRKDGGTSLVGQKVGSAKDLVILSQVLRDPRFETFRIFYTAGGEIVGEAAYSSRLPGAAYLPNTTPDTIKADMERFVADGYWLEHNHPSGAAMASQADIRLTERLAKEAPGFLGHVIIDHNQFGHITVDPYGNAHDSVVDAPELENTNLRANHEVPHPFLGEAISSPEVFARMAKRLQQKDGFITLIGIDSQQRVTLITEVPKQTLDVAKAGRESELRLLARVKRATRETGSRGLFAVVPGNLSDYRGLVDARIFIDVVDSTGRSAAAMYGSHALPETRVEQRGGKTKVAEDVKRSTPRLAPNGKRSNLTEQQWAQVRTPEFKQWFGDWEKHAAKADNPVGSLWSDENVSKVVDENGEPLVVYHGAKDGGFSLLDPYKGDKHRSPMVFAAKTPETARSYSGRGDEIVLPALPTTRAELEADYGYEFDETEDGVDVTDGNGYPHGPYDNMDAAVAAMLDEAQSQPLEAAGDRGVYSLFLNIRNPNEAHFGGANWDGQQGGLYSVWDSEEQTFVEYSDTEALAEEEAQAMYESLGGDEVEFDGRPRYDVQQAPDRYETTNSVAEEALRFKNDGAIIRQVVDDGGQGGYVTPDDVFVFFDAKQAKSATQNTGAFSTKHADIRRSKGRKTPEQLRQDFAGLVGQGNGAVTSHAEQALLEAEQDWIEAKRGVVSHEESEAAAERLAHRLGWSTEAVSDAMKRGSVNVGDGKSIPAAELLGAGAATSRLAIAKLLDNPDAPDFAQQMASTINLMVATRANLSEIGRALSYAGWMERKPGMTDAARRDAADKALNAAGVAADDAVAVTGNMTDEEKAIVADYNKAMADLGDARMATEETAEAQAEAQGELDAVRQRVHDARQARDEAKQKLRDANAELKKEEQRRDNAVDRTPSPFAITQAEGAARRAANEAKAAKDWERLVKERLKSAQDRLARAQDQLQKARDNAVDPAELKRMEQKARLAEAEATLATNALKEAQQKLRDAAKRLKDAQQKEADAKAARPTAHDISQAQGLARRAEQAADKAVADLRAAQRELSKARARLRAAQKRADAAILRLQGVVAQTAELRKPQFLGKGGVSMAEIEAYVGGKKGLARIQAAMRAHSADLDLGQVAQFFQGIAQAIYNMKLEQTKRKGIWAIRHKFLSGVLEQFRAFNLTGLFTHGINLISNAAFATLEMSVTRALEQGLDSGPKGVARHYRLATRALLRTLADVQATAWFGLTQEFPAAHFEALANARPETRQDLLDLGGNKWMDTHGGALPGGYGRAVRSAGFSPLGAMDLLFKIVPYRYHIALQEAKNPGKPVDFGKAVAFAEFGTFQTKLGELTGKLPGIVASLPELGFMLPYIKTLVNLIKTAAMLEPVLSTVIHSNDLARVNGTEAQRLAIARVAVSLALAAVVLSLYGDGDDDEDNLLQGPAPLDPGEKALWESNHTALGLKVGDKRISLQRLEPLGGAATLIIADKEAFKLVTEGEIKAAGLKVLEAWGQLIVGKSFMKGPADALAATLDVEGKGDRYVERTGASILYATLIPNFFSQLGDMTDPVQRETVNPWTDTPKRRLPGLREQLNPKLGWDGETIENPRHGSISPLPMEKSANSRAADWLLRNAVPLQAQPKALKPDEETGERLSLPVRQRLLRERAARLGELTGDVGLTAEMKKMQLSAKGRQRLQKEAQQAASGVKGDWSTEVTGERWDAGLEKDED